MLAKIIHVKSSEWTIGESQRRLKQVVKYVVSGGEDKVLDTWSVNTVGDMELAEIDMKLLLEENQRATGNRIEHVVVSFSEEDKPTKEELKEIEKRISSSLGYGEHQRIVAVHQNTENLHFHIVLNKIHPQKQTLVEHYRAYHKLEKACRELEKEYGLKQKEMEQRTREGGGRNFERSLGLESFERWLGERVALEVREYLQDGEAGWEGLQKMLAKYDVKIRQYGRGMVFSHREKKLFVKVSSLGRDFSSAKLVAKLGEYQEIDTSYLVAQESYQVGRPEGGIGEELYQKFKEERGDRGGEWLLWLRKRGELGDEKALEVLRSRYREVAPENGDIIVGSRKGILVPVVGYEIRVSRRGVQQYYREGEKIFSDAGPYIVVHQEDKEAVERAVQYAVERFGGELEFRGSREFCRRGWEVLEGSRELIVSI